ncbi:SusC/RagA family TonB-linked outer membrane protein [Mucilaginibacter sp. 44-25]|uniref:SusC/RagA family TonB-linked outer membrane protein n=1 Tax=Mucilaginibacter sp. 44-25 TaxID=1895794 RepID=UPI000B253158|nr:SusC/RagA family TonB-linked outer membrane protein [Mucilaginibacter sp. 44-25]
MKKTILFIVLATLCFFFNASAQINSRPPNTNFTGKVIDEQGTPLPGATVKIQNESRISITDKDGKFTFTNAPRNGAVSVSFIGFQTANIPMPLNFDNEFTIQLKADANSLNEVQVIGYGTTTKRLNTGSVSTITATDIEKQPVTNILSALSGRASGVNVQTTNGLPGGDVSIQIRGKGSLTAGTNPLYIIDGVPFASTSLVYNTALAAGINGAISPLNSLNPNDIENISILKDADATAIYGSRGANGVVLITTKKGKSGKAKTDIILYQGISQVANLPKLLNLQDYLTIRKEAFKNDGLTPSSDPTSPSYAPDLKVWDTNKSTDWAKYILGGTGHVTNLQANISGGNEQTTFALGTNYRTESSVLPGDNRYTRGGIHMNVQYISPDRKFNVLMSTSYTQDNNKLVNPAIALSSDILLPPNFPIYDQNRKFNFLNGINPAASVQNTSNIQTNNIITNAVVSYNILAGLQIKTSAGLNYLNMNQIMVNPKSAQDPSISPQSSAYFGNNSTKSFIVEPQINYSLKKNKSNLDVLLGGTFQKTENKGEIIYATNFNSESQLENLASAATLRPSNSYIDYKYVSIFGRVTYNWDEKYLINASVRRDGSSRFGPGNQFGNFGAVGVAWIFSNEGWIKSNLSWLSFGKIRSSYGIIGNDQIADYQYLSTYKASNYVYQNITGLTPARIANDDFHWESNKKFEIGLDIGLTGDRVLLTINRFQNRSGSQLVNYAIPFITGFDSYQANLPALIQNQGWEVEISTRNIQKPNFTWSTNFNITTSKNILKSFPDLATSSYANIYIVGESITRAYGFRFAGADSQTGASLYQVKTGGTSSSPAFENFYYTMGDTNPKYYGGMNNAITYKNFQLDLFAQFSRQSLPGSLIPSGSLSNNFAVALSRWQTPGNSTNIPKATTGTDDYYYTLSSANFFNASYIRLKNVSLSYTFPEIWTKSRKIDRLRIYAQGENIATWWDKNTALYDPESGASANVPPLRTITIGFQITL